jgi:hypothetical protein
MARVAYSCIGMKVQKHVNSKTEAFWYRCKRVVFEQDSVKWELKRTGRYELLKAYAQKPHRQLVEASDDDTLRAFIKAWGPLNLSELKAWEGSDLISNYRRERDTLRAWVRLLAAIESPEYLYDSILGLLRLFSKGDFIWLRHRLGIGSLEDGFDDDMEKRLVSATPIEIADVCSYLAGIFPLLAFPHFVIDRTGKGSPIVRASSGVTSLTTALYWMVWQDIFMESPWQFCEECHKLFQPDFHHKRKFCLPECAHRKAARESARRKREGERKANVTRKAR